MSTRMPSSMHVCKWLGCTAEIRSTHWACEPHWWRIPMRLRVELNRAWQSLTRIRNATALEHTARLHGTRSPPALRAALERYRKAEQAIVDFALMDT